ncbi:6908_t:CDS:2 [Funneliformis mosseae]|uniref:6908_t:CDS:1 n=1 Tax=Funneliformis mosseae TaxID=27381 RepID=A0A9N9F147_FUNMO|nr:6908_t:CDS:2 [Funneliformis mosseae]
MGKKTEKVTTAKATKLSDKKNGKTKNIKLPSITKNGTSVKKILKASSSESDSSDSDSSGPKKANVSDTSGSDIESDGNKLNVKNKIKKTSKISIEEDSKDSSASESSSDDSSDSSEEEAEIKPKKKKLNVKKEEVSSSEEESNSEGKIKSKDESSSSESDSSESEEEVVSSKINGTNKVDVSKTHAPKQESSDSSSSSESESDSDEDIKMVPKTPEVNNSISGLNSSKRKIDQDDSNFAKKPKVYENPSESNTIFVGRLSYNVDAEWLRQEFKEAGEIVDVRIASDRNTGRSKGFGYVEFATAEGASNAMKFSGKEIDGREINLDFATQQQSKKNNNIQRGTSEVSDTLFVGNLAFSITEDQIWETFGQYGQIVSVRLPTHEDSGGLKGFGYVQFADTDSAQKAMELHGTKICDRAIRLDFSIGKSQGGNNSRFGNRNGVSFGRGGRGGRGGGGRGGRGRGGNDYGRGGRGGFNPAAAANRGAIQPAKGKKITFED